MSFHQEFVDAAKDKGRLEVHHKLGHVSGDIAVFAQNLPAVLETLLTRLKAGEAVSEWNDETLRMKSDFGGYYSAKPLKEDIEKLPGYRRLLATCAAPDIDVCCLVSVEMKAAGWGEKTVSIRIVPSKPFSDSVLDIADGTKREHIGIGQQPVEGLLSKPLRRKPVLTLRKD